jgi:hypothetical protein
MTRPMLKLHIEELVLHSFDPHDRYAIANAFQQELSRLLTEQLVNSRIASAGRVDAGAFQVEQHTKPNSIGNQIAGVVHRGLTK